MKLDLAIAVFLLSGMSLASGRTHLGSHGHGQQRFNSNANAALARAAAAAAAPPVEPFNFMDLELLQKALQTESGNVVLSPASVKTTLSMLFEGADGKTADELSQALRLGRIKSRERQEQLLHQFQNNLTMRSPGTGNMAVPTLGSTLEVASHLFHGDAVQIKPTYMETLKSYNAAPQRVNMSDPERAAAEINKWVSEATHQHIPTLVRPESLTNTPLMVLANAVFFQGTWQNAFDPEATQEKCFYPGGGAECVKVSMMETTGAFRSKLIHELDSTMLELPYDDGRFAMIILLPEHRDGMEQLLREMDCCSNLLNHFNQGLEDAEYVVAIPKFAIEFNTDLVPVLRKMKISDIFSRSANLTRMVKQEKGSKLEPAVSNVFHKAKITVDERGAIAAGASGALVVPLMGGPQPRFVADHPFLFFIRDMRTGGFLFAGRVSQPQTEGVEEGSNAAYVPYAENAATPPQPAAPAPAPGPVYHHGAPVNNGAYAAHAAHADAQPATTTTTKRSPNPVKDATMIKFPQHVSSNSQ